MFTLSIFDIPFLGNTIRYVSTPVSGDVLIVDLSGSNVWTGSYELFEDYTIGSPPSNKGIGWDGNWIFTPSYPMSWMAWEFFSLGNYSAGQTISGSDGGSGWDGPWNIIAGM